MCPLLAGLMRAAANEAPASVTKYLSKPSGCITIKLPQTARVRKDVPTPMPPPPHPTAARTDTWTGSPSPPPLSVTVGSVWLKKTGVCVCGGGWLDVFSVFVWGWRVER